MLSNLGYDVYYSGISSSFFHRIRRIISKEKPAKKKVDDIVRDVDINSFFPLTMRDVWYKNIANNIFIKNVNKKNPIFNINFDVVICDYPFFYSVLSKIKYKKLIYRPTDNYTSMSGEKVRFYEKKICYEAQKIISTSETVKNEILKNYGVQLKDKSHVIENGYDQNFFYNKNENINRKNCVYIGALDYRFDYEALKVLANENPEVSFDIFGPLPKNYLSSIEPNFRNCGNVSFKGVVDYEIVPEILNRYRVGILPLTNNDSNRGRSPMKLWEYLSCGLNIVYSNIEHVNEIPCVHRYNNLNDINEIFNKAYTQTEKPEDLNTIIESNSWLGKVNLLLKYVE
jgi:teichuronic acid biosynthesis glycosyltransferase TuaH